MEKKHSPETEAFYRKLILPEAEKAEPNTPPRRIPVVSIGQQFVCIEHYRRPESLPQRKVS